ncbi:MAG: hypothetical protein Q8P68_06030 [Candidatus Peregrinibacteria bacterium]|nr:hypothetical protein [Candidatus Peregrinibacteria bacterium]MDZ4244784.1 hypothetical protein [Candidatus Gracilibacteria bacterium]
MVYHARKNQTHRENYYMTIDLERIKNKKKVTRKKTLTSEVKSGYKMLIATVIILNLVIGAAYFMINGQKTVLGYQLNELQLTNKQLKNESKRIESNIVNATAFKEIEKNAQMRQMVNISDVNYSIGSTRTAKNY